MGVKQKDRERFDSLEFHPSLSDLSLTRRQFAAACGGMLALSLTGLRISSGKERGDQPAGTSRYDDWTDVYRQKFTWDRRVRCTHVVNCWYQRNCAWDVFVKDDIVLREEQAAAYPQVQPDVPDFNPRGCQKGACYSALLYAPDRLRYPLKRLGERGLGRWKRVTWDEALREVADHILDAISQEGPDALVLAPGGSLASGTWRFGVERLVSMLDGVQLETNTELDDGQGGAAVTFGTPVASRSADDFMRSKVILIWGANPTYTQIPNAHFVNEARYHGSTVVTIAPDYSASSIHSDLFIPVRPGTDAALALAVAQVLIESNRIDVNFVRLQTDLPLLVRDDGRFLRESDLREGGRKDRFYVFDEKKKKVVAAPARTLSWGPVRPALRGSYEVDALTGRLTVRPVLAVLYERLKRDYTPEKAGAICGVSPQVIRRLASIIAGARSLSGVAGSCIPKFYHGDLIMRAQILLFVLGGHLGKPGAGFDTCPFLLTDGLSTIGGSQLEALTAKLKRAPAYIKRRLGGDSRERIFYDLLRDYTWRVPRINSVLYWRKHAEMQERTDRDWGRNLPRPLDNYLEESFSSGWQKPPPDTPPRVLLIAGSNLVRRLRSADLLLKNAWPKISLVVTTDIRMSTTCLHSDILLPGASSYEKDDVPNWITLLSPYFHVTQAAVPPLAEAKAEWEIHARLAGWIEKRAAEREIIRIKGRNGNSITLNGFHRRFTFAGKFADQAQSAVAAELVRQTSFVNQSFDEMRSLGFSRITGIGSHPINLGNATDVADNQPVVSRSWRRRRPQPWPTLTARIQFYVDHPLYLELGEELPTHKEPPLAGGNYPLVLSGGHTRWSIHAGWRNLRFLLHLQRGEAAAFVAEPDAHSRGIADGERIRLYNDVGEFQAVAKLSRALRPGMVILYHAWEDYHFRGRSGYRNVLPSPLNPVELAGKYYHLRPVPASLQPGQSDRETRVEMEKVKGTVLQRL